MALLSAFCILHSAFAADVTWTAHPSDGVTMRLTREGTINQVAFDFRGHGGYAIARRDMNLDLPPNYQFVFRVRAEAPPENLEFKLISGDNVWWLNRRDFVFPRAWTTLTTKKRKIEFAWGPSRDPLRHVDAIEVVVTAGSGGRGTVWFSDPELEALPPSPTEAVRAPNVIDFGAKRELGGLEILPPAKNVRVFLDGVECGGHAAAVIAPARPAHSTFVWLPDAEARRIRVEGAKEIIVEPPGWADTANDFWSIVAKHARRGDYPRYLIGEQPYWTVVGADGADAEALVGEDGNVEPFKGGESIEPFLIVRGRRLTWADVAISQSLEDGYLPIPTVTWRANRATMTMTAAISASSMLQLRYRVHGAKLHLEVRPFQVNPSTQFLNSPGGVARVKHALPRMHHFELDIPLAKGAKRQSFEQIARDWREKLNRVRIDIAGAPKIANTIRTSLAYTLIHRDGAALKPGSRSYDRAWIRDGALLGAMLLRLGHAAEAKAFAEWFAKYQYEDGKVPCCVDSRGADPVPENDSHGELIYLVREIERLTGERLLQSHVDAAARYIESLRTYEGLVTESISHEGYSAKPVHSYWDDFFAIQGVPAIQRDLLASMNKVIAEHHLDYVPASVELADFDPTSTAIAISPLGVALPPLRRTYERYFAEIAKPRDDWTPYEMRIIGAMVRLGDRAHALELIERFMADRRPAAWNEWAEVVGREYRKPRFIGDMPHAWVASDFVRSILEAIAYDREDGALVIGAGIPAAWLPLHVGPLPTYQGAIDVRISRDGVVTLQGSAKNVVIAAPFRSAHRTDARAPDRR
jgi:hypothetical protein